MCWYCCLVLGRSDKVVKSVRVVVVVFRFWGRLDKNVWVCCSDGGSRSFMTGALGPSLPPLPPFHSPILSLLLLLSPIPLISTPSDPFCPPPPPHKPLIPHQTQAFADALLIVPKTLAENSGFDVQVGACVLAFLLACPFSPSCLVLVLVVSPPFLPFFGTFFCVVFCIDVGCDVGFASVSSFRLAVFP